MATILKLSDGIAVENDSLRLTFPLAGGVIGRYYLYGRRGGSFELAAAVDPVSEITYRTQDGATITEKVTAAGYEMDRRGADCILRLESEFHDPDGVRWTANIEFYVPDEGPRVTVTSRLAAGRPRQLLAFRGPFLRVRSVHGTKRTAALFPGLDWVVGDERSSSPDTAPPPFDNRFAPNPYKITVPLMAVARGGLVTGITWDPLQVWDGERVESSANRYPTAVFASPDFIDQTDSHLLGLLLPSVPKFVDENTLVAARPYDLTPGRELRLECSLFVLDSPNVVEAVGEYLQLGGLIPPPPKTRDYHENLGLDYDTYLERAWSREHAAWAQSSSTEGKRTFFYSEPVALALWRGSLFAKDEGMKRRMRECVEAAIAAHGGASGLATAYFRGGFARELELARGRADKLARSQHPDGGWSPDEDVLGHSGRSLIGVTADRAARLLRSALWTGNTAHLEAGIRAIRFLDGCDRPSGLRVWDVHENAPDLLAVAHLLAAYLDEYLITGNARRLERAVYWGWAGLPFVYLWHAHNRDVMRYATVPFFAVTVDRRPWFGVTAQWNGLLYARELFRLSRYDRTLRWHRIGRAITLCAMQLQKTGEHAPAALIGFYPDAYNVVDGRDYYPLCLGPQLITENVLHLMGEETEPVCEVVPWREKRVRITTVARLLAIRSTPQRLVVRMSFPAGETAYLTLAAGDRPTAVLLGEKPIPEIDSLADVRRCWHHDAENALSIVRIQFAEPEEVLEFRF